MNAARAGLVGLAVLAVLAVTMRMGANVAPAHPWHYPCVEHLARAGRSVWEWFTPRRLFRAGRCQQ